MKTKIVLLWLLLVLLVGSCQAAAPAPLPTPAGQLETQAAATAFAGQTSAAQTEQAASLTLTAAAPSLTSTPVPAPTAKIIKVNVPADACWINSGIFLATGQSVIMDATGTANTWDGKDISNGDPDGQPRNMCGDVRCPLIGHNYGALIGRLGEKGETFLVGNLLVFTAPKDGDLYFTINDWECDDNIGGFEVAIKFR